MLRKFITAKKENQPFVELWGTGTPRREFLHVDDLADACFYLLEHYNEKGLVNVGWGNDVTILELAQLVKKTIGYEGELRFDVSKPDGTPQKLMDVSKLRHFGWTATIKLEEGIKLVYDEIKDFF